MKNVSIEHSKRSATSFDRKRWRTLILYCAMNLCVGSLYAWSVLAGPLQTHLQSGDLSLVYTVSTAISSVTMIGGGFLQQRLGSRRVLFIGGVLFGLGLVLSSFVTAAPYLLLTYGLGCGMGEGTVYGCTLSTAINLFPERRGFAGGVVTAVYGFGSVLTPPVASMLIRHVGIVNTLRILGTGFFLVICLATSFVEDTPKDITPMGGELGQGKTWLQMLSDPVFYWMFLFLFCGVVSGSMIISRASALAQMMAGMSEMGAAIMVSVLSLFSVGGRLVAGPLSDKLGRINTLLMMLLISLLGMVILLLVGRVNQWLFIPGIMAIGVGYGSFLAVFPGMVADRFGPRYQNVNYGIMFLAFSLAGVVGPSGASLIYAETSRYTGAFLMAIAFCLLGIVLNAVLRRADFPF